MRLGYVEILSHQINQKDYSTLFCSTIKFAIKNPAGYSDS